VAALGRDGEACRFELLGLDPSLPGSARSATMLCCFCEQDQPGLSRLLVEVGLRRLGAAQADDRLAAVAHRPGGRRGTGRAGRQRRRSRSPCAGASSRRRPQGGRRGSCGPGQARSLNAWSRPSTPPVSRVDRVQDARPSGAKAPDSPEVGADVAQRGADLGKLLVDSLELIGELLGRRALGLQRRRVRERLVQLVGAV
jgi:hypothetical protein